MCSVWLWHDSTGGFTFHRSLDDQSSEREGPTQSRISPSALDYTKISAHCSSVPR